MKKDVFYFNSLGVQLYLSDLLDPCKTEEQVERIRWMPPKKQRTNI